MENRGGLVQAVILKTQCTQGKPMHTLSTIKLLDSKRTQPTR